RRRFVGDRRFARRRGTDGGDVGVGAERAQHVAAAVGGRFAGRERGLARARDRTGVAFGFGVVRLEQRGVAGVLDGEPLFCLLCQLVLLLPCCVLGFFFIALRLPASTLFPCTTLFRSRRRFVGDRRFARRRGTDGGDVGVGAERAQHVAAAVGGRFAGR